MKHLCTLIFLVSTAYAQPAFEVASVRPSSASGDTKVNVGVHIDGARVSFNSLSLQDYIAFAYDVKGHQIVGPDWLAGERFDIAATLPPGTERPQVRAMVQTLLAERFGLKLHKDSKEFPVYAIVRGKGPLKLKETAPDPDNGNAEPQKPAVNVTGGGSRNGVNIDYGGGSWFAFANNKLEGKKLSMARLAETLARFEDRPVVEMTALAGNYDFVLDFTPEDYQAMLIRSAVNAGMVLPPQAIHAMEAASGDSLMTSIESLGLKLDRRKAPLDVLVVDKIDRTPAAN
jgi:uncharacterized protein (TIGR03435 family)